MKVRTAPEAQVLHGAPGSMVATAEDAEVQRPMSTMVYPCLPTVGNPKNLYVWQWKITSYSDHLGSSIL